MPYRDPAANRERARRYYHEHKEERREYNRQYRLKHKDTLAEDKRQWYRGDRENILAKRRAIYRASDEELQKKRENERAWRAAHRQARLESGQKSYRKNRDAILARRNNRKLAELEAEALRPKPKSCDVCGNDKARIEFDHCHDRGIFRGWICHPCNVILGFAEDDPNRLRKLIAYLERTSVLLPPQLTLPGV